MPVSLPTELGEISLRMYVFHPGEKLPDPPASAFQDEERIPVGVILRDARNRQIHATVKADRQLYKLLQVSGGDYSVSYDTYSREFIALSLYKNEEIFVYSLDKALVDETL